MTREEVAKARLSVEKFDKAYQLARNLVENLVSTCLNCNHWQENPSNEFQYNCKKHNLMPPPRIIVNGCNEHSDLIPFQDNKMMKTKTYLRQVALEAAVKMSQNDRNIDAFSVIAEANRYFEWLLKDEIGYIAPSSPSNNLDDEIPF